MKIAVYPGSFDPVTYGHLDILKRANTLFDKVIIAVARDNYKDGLFNLESRVNFVTEVTRNMSTVEVDVFEGLTVDYCNRRGAQAIIRGLRAVSDFEYEMQMSLMNKELQNNIETVFFMTDAKYSFISSSMIRQVASLRGDVSEFVPPEVAAYLLEKFGRRLNSRNYED